MSEVQGDDAHDPQNATPRRHDGQRDEELKGAAGALSAVLRSGRARGGGFTV
jgi:hypothetical protein